MKEQNRNMSREELEKIWCKNNANVPRMESEYPATPEEAIMLNGKDVMKALKQYEVPTGSIKIWDLPEGYQFTDENGNVINATKIVLEKKQKEYPKTYEECCKVMRCDPWFEMNTCYHGNELSHLYRLLICRDAYWKIAGEEMGLGKPWKPELDNNEKIFYIHNVSGKIYVCEGVEIENQILAFPTEEMRDAFYENFKELIEQCKELL